MGDATTTEPPVWGGIWYEFQTPPNMVGGVNPRVIYVNGQLVPDDRYHPDHLLGWTDTSGVRLADSLYTPLGKWIVNRRWPHQSHVEDCAGGCHPLD